MMITSKQIDQVKYFEANDELANILIAQGLTDTTSKGDKAKGKRSFRTSKGARKEVYFNRINIQIKPSRNPEPTTRLTEEELRMILLFIKLSAKDYAEISNPRSFKLKDTAGALDWIRDELEELEQMKYREKRQKKLKRILDTFDSIRIKKTSEPSS